MALRGGHVAKLELLGQDSPYARTSNGQVAIAVSDLQLRLPVHELPGSSPGVGSPRPPVTAHPHRAPACVARPFSKLNGRRVRTTRRRLTASGTAGETLCAHSSSGGHARDRVAHVYVMIYRPAAHGRCRFIRRNGTLTQPRSCARPVEFLASGTAHWRLRLHLPIPPGTYLVRSDAVDGHHRHQARSAASVTRVRIRPRRTRAG